MTERQPPSWMQEGSHPAEDDRLFMDGLFSQAGTVGNHALTPSNPGGMIIRVQDGGAVVQGDTSPVQGKYHVYNDDVVDLTVGTADGANPRIDLVVAQINDDTYDGSGNSTWQLKVLAGAPNPTPVDPTVPDSCLLIARQHVPAGTSDLTVAGVLEDLRPRAFVGAGLPPGSMLDFGGLVAPSGFFITDGAAKSRATYAQLFAVIGTAYGAGDGTTTFNIPDTRGRVGVGYGGHAAARMAAADSMSNFGGTETVTLTSTQIPLHAHGAGTLGADSAGAHTHVVKGNVGGTDVDFIIPQIAIGASEAVVHAGSADATAHTVTFSNPDAVSAGAHGHTVSGSTANNAGGGGPHSNMPPYLTVQKIIKF